MGICEVNVFHWDCTLFPVGTLMSKGHLKHVKKHIRNANRFDVHWLPWSTSYWHRKMASKTCQKSITQQSYNRFLTNRFLTSLLNQFDVFLTWRLFTCISGIQSPVSIKLFLYYNNFCVLVFMVKRIPMCGCQIDVKFFDIKSISIFCHHGWCQFQIIFDTKVPAGLLFCNIQNKQKFNFDAQHN